MRNKIRCRVRGRVQGVFFRDSTRRMAESLGIHGHAINLPDGSVEVLAEGTADSVAMLREWLHEGPAQARVDSVDCQAADVEVSPGFRTG